MSNILTIELHAKPGKRDEFVQILKDTLGDTRAFDGCLAAQLWIPEDDDSVIEVYEEWESREHQAKYFQWRVDSGMVEAIGPFIVAPPKVRWRRVLSV